MLHVRIYTMCVQLYHIKSTKHDAVYFIDVESYRYNNANL